MKSRISKNLKDTLRRNKIRSLLPHLIEMINFGIPFEKCNQMLDLQVENLGSLIELFMGESFVDLNDYGVLRLKVEIYELNSFIIKKIATSLMYPLGLILTAFFLMVFYVYGFSNALTTMLDSFQSINSPLYYASSKTFIFLVIFAFFLIVLFSIIFSLNISLGRLVLSKFCSSFRVYNTLIYIKSLAILTTYYGKFLDSIDTLSRFPKGSHIFWLNSVIKNNLGENSLLLMELDRNVYDSNLRYFIRNTTEIDLKNLNEMYRKYAMKSLENGIKKFSMVMKFIGIVMVLMVIVVYYNALMMPLRIMEGL